MSSYLAVIDETGKLAGIIRLRDLVQYQQSSSVIITDSIRRARSLDDIPRLTIGCPPWSRQWSTRGRHPLRQPNRLRRLRRGRAAAARYGQEKLGPAPVHFAFLALGSEGREEQTLLTDQDNALLYEDPPRRRRRRRPSTS